MKILDPNGLVDNIYKYVQTNIEIAKVEVQEKIEDTIKKVAIIAILVLSGAMLFIFILLTLALFLNQILDSHYLGFLIVSILLAVIMATTHEEIFTRFELTNSPICHLSLVNMTKGTTAKLS